MKNETMRDQLAKAIAPRIADWVFGPDQLTDPNDSGAYDIADIALAALGLDDLPALAERGAKGLADGLWEHSAGAGDSHPQPCRREDIAYAVLTAALSTEGEG